MINRHYCILTRELVQRITKILIMVLYVMFLALVAIKGAHGEACSDTNCKIVIPRLEKASSYHVHKRAPRSLLDDIKPNPNIGAITHDLSRNPESRLNSIELMFSRFTDMSEEPQTAFTIEEVAQYDGRNGRPLLIIVDGRVYDITDFLPYHPGGTEVLLEYGGQDVTQEMRDSPMPEIVYSNFLHLFLIGWIDENPETSRI